MTLSMSRYGILLITAGGVDDESARVAVALSLVVGFTVSAFAFRLKSRWCPACGRMTTAMPERTGQHRG